MCRWSCDEFGISSIMASITNQMSNFIWKVLRASRSRLGLWATDNRSSNKLQTKLHSQSFNLLKNRVLWQRHLISQQLPISTEMALAQPFRRLRGSGQGMTPKPSILSISKSRKKLQTFAKHTFFIYKISVGDFSYWFFQGSTLWTLPKSFKIYRLACHLPWSVPITLPVTFEVQHNMFMDFLANLRKLISHISPSMFEEVVFYTLLLTISGSDTACPNYIWTC